jgi:hypothetical protein
LSNQAWLDQRLAQEPFPGEDEGVLDGYLRNRDFAAQVVEQSREVRFAPWRHLSWSILVFVALAAALVYGSFPELRALSWPYRGLLLHVLLGTVVALSVVGWALTLDPFRHGSSRSRSEEADQNRS